AGSWTVQAYWDGDTSYNGAASASVPFTVQKAMTSVSCVPSRFNKMPGDTVSVSGAVVPSPSVGGNLSGLGVTIYFNGPNATSDNQTVYTDSAGNFYLNNYAGMNQAGPWTVTAQFLGDTRYEAGTSSAAMVDVSDTAGYAIIVQGKQSGGEGLDAHNVTTNNVYNKLIGRGLRPEDIRYFNYNFSQSGVYAATTKAGVSDAITNWAKDKMNNVSPGPLYIIFAGHGDPGLFRVYQSGDASLDTNNITPAEVDQWLDALEAGLNVANSESPVYFIYGACYSGSFVPALSDNTKNRVIITSASADEESMRQNSKNSNHTGDGEWFINRFFLHTNNAETIADRFERAANAVEQSGQSPLLDDNGDTVGSDALYPSSSDGLYVMNKEIGFSSNAGAPVGLFAVSPSVTIGAEETNPGLLWAKVTDVSRIGQNTDIWIEVVAPNYAPDTSTGQVIFNVPVSTADSYNATLQRFEWTSFIDTQDNPIEFTAPGMYEVYYYAVDNLTGDVSDFMLTRVYKSAPTPTPPSSFNLVSPANNGSAKTTLVLLWGASSDPDGFTYTVEISRDQTFATVDKTIEGVTQTFLPVDSGVGLSDSTDYYWRVTAVDRYGASTQAANAPFMFHTNNANGLSGIVCGFVKDGSGLPISGATVNVGAYSTSSLSNGGYFLMAPAGTYSMLVQAAGHTAWSQGVNVSAGVTTYKNPVLTALSDTTAPSSAITAPASGTALASGLASYNVTGTASDTESGLMLVEVSTDGGATWNPATDIASPPPAAPRLRGAPSSSPGDPWTVWSYSWTSPANGCANILSRATDNATNVETPGAGVTVSVGNAAMVSMAPAVGGGGPAQVGKTITWQSTASGVCGNYEFRYQILPEGGTWSVARNWSSDPDWAWAPATAGKYQITGQVRKVGGVAPDSSINSGWYEVYDPNAVPAITSLTPGVITPAEVGTPVL
ncbi:MAG TPA: carboxypeptidase regulatory-like domain-containing protein, partial [Nitrospirota bacterium]